MKRRTFLRNTTLASAALILPSQAFNSTAKKEKLTFGIVADVHHGMIPDTQERLEVFIKEAIERDVDFIVQMGDFCHLEEKSKSFLKLWEEFKKPKFHVLGNHDMDLASKAEIMDFWGMKDKYYTFDQKGIRFIVLDANYLYQDGKFIDYDNANFYVDNQLRTYINDEQIEWFESELASSSLPVIVLSHQSLWHYQWGVKNRLAIQRAMETHQKKVICCLNGHNHIDFHRYQNGINYIEINSMSYHWMGDKYKVNRYPQELLKDYKWLNHIAPYQDPLYAFATIHPKGKMEISGVRSQWVTPSPKESGAPRPIWGNRYSPIISDYAIKF